MIFVKMTNTDCGSEYVFSVAETEDGEIAWRAMIIERPHPPLAAEVTYMSTGWRPYSREQEPFRGALSGTPVSGAEAEAITGLHMPAAMDKLREMIHDARNPFENH